MSKLNKLFRQRIGLDENEKISFEKLDTLLEKTAVNIPFENMCIISNNITDITKERLINKVLVEREGGLCYELNSLLYLFLLDNGFNVKLLTGIVFDQTSQDWSRTGRTHVTILLTTEENTFLVDTGFGANLPLRPVPLTGETVISRTGAFRVRRAEDGAGDFILEMKLKRKGDEWQTGYVFDSSQPVSNLSEMNAIQKIIAESKFSSFNKNPLLTRVTTNGNITLTDTDLMKWNDGILTKEPVEDKNQFKELAKQHFQIEDPVT